MAVFMINTCKFSGCGITFPRLPNLIEHIENVHIDYDPAVIEQKEASQPSCVPLSYVLRFLTENSRREFRNVPSGPDVDQAVSGPKTSIGSNTPTVSGSEIDDEEVTLTPSEDSNDSWTTVEEYSSEYILRYGVKMNANASISGVGTSTQDKPFACPVPGCKKRYKNVNGIKYHSKNGHKKDGKVKKAYKCQCGKSYKTAQGLKSHSVTQHVTNKPVSLVQLPSTATATSIAAPRSQIQKMPGLVVTASPSQSHSRPVNFIDRIDGNKLVRVYDNIKTRDLPPFTIPKPLNIVTNSQKTQGIPSSILTPDTFPGSSQVDSIKSNQSPRVTVHSAPSAAVFSYNGTAN